MSTTQSYPPGSIVMAKLGGYNGSNKPKRVKIVTVEDGGGWYKVVACSKRGVEFKNIDYISTYNIISVEFFADPLVAFISENKIAAIGVKSKSASVAIQIKRKVKKIENINHYINRYERQKITLLFELDDLRAKAAAEANKKE